MANVFNAKNMYILSDNHFYHANIIKYCDRNYNYEDEADVLNMNEDMLKRFDALPDDKDTVVWNLGDLSFGKMITKSSDPFNELRRIVNRMKGENRTLCYVLGNHDYDLYKMIGKKAFAKSVVDFFRGLGFDYVYNHPIMFNENIILSHEPVYLKPGTGIKNIHGHTHNVNVSADYFKVDIENYEMKLRAARKDGMTDIPEALLNWPHKDVDLEDYINVSLDANEMKILNLNEIIKKIF